MTVAEMNPSLDRDSSIHTSNYAMILGFLNNPESPVEFGQIRNEIGKNRHDALAFLKSWLFFGTLCEVFNIVGVDLELHKYIRRDRSGRQFVTTQHLQNDLKTWQRRECNLNTKVKTEQAREVDTVVKFASTVAGSFEEPGCPLPVSEVLLPVRILCWTLDSAAIDIYGCILHTKHLEKSHYLSWCFEQDGWCPNKSNMIVQIWPLSVQYYAYLLGPSKASEDHYTCSKELCVSEQGTTPAAN